MTYRELLVENVDQKKRITSLEEQLAGLYKPISGFKSENFVTPAMVDQLSLFGENTSQTTEETPQETISYTNPREWLANTLERIPEHRI